MNRLKKLKSELKKAADVNRAKSLSRFFKTGPGQYGWGDRFLGIALPITRAFARRYKDFNFSEIRKLLRSEFHEERMVALLILLEQYKESSELGQKRIFEFYIKNTKYINNWDLVDVTCRDVVGAYLFEWGRKIIPTGRQILFRLAKSKNIWERRIAIVSTWYFIRRNSFYYTLEISKILLSDKNDLIHKAVGWMLREVGKRDEKLLERFLRDNYDYIPRTTLRYAIERFPEVKRKRFLNWVL
jgi:3-methyladenine DNA glycosylase AlkD